MAGQLSNHEDIKDIGDSGAFATRIRPAVFGLIISKHLREILKAISPTDLLKTRISYRERRLRGLRTYTNS